MLCRAVCYAVSDLASQPQDQAQDVHILLQGWRHRCSAQQCWWPGAAAVVRQDKQTCVVMREKWYLGTPGQQHALHKCMQAGESSPDKLIKRGHVGRAKIKEATICSCSILTGGSAHTCVWCLALQKRWASNQSIHERVAVGLQLRFQPADLSLVSANHPADRRESFPGQPAGHLRVSLTFQRLLVSVRRQLGGPCG